jgi:putative transcriptional regulator
LGVPENEEYLKQLGDKIRKIRMRKKITQTELANLCEFEKSNLARIEAGGTNPTIKTLKKIADALGVKVSKLIDF